MLMEGVVRLRPNSVTPIIRTNDINGQPFDLSGERSKPLLISFFRYASCPLCNLRVHDLISNYKENSNQFDCVAIFQSPASVIQKYVGQQQIPFPVLPDPERIFYRKYGVESSWLGFLKAWTTKVPTILKAIFMKGFFPGSIQGELHRIPADFLVDTDNRIMIAYYGKDIGDHVPMRDVRRAINHEKKY